MKIVPIQPAQAFPLSAAEAGSFRGLPTPGRISGPPNLVRLVQRGGRKAGAFWFEETVFTKLRHKARTELAQQNPGRQQPFNLPMKDMVGLYMKLCLRSDLAICKNWTANFDAYAVLPLGPADSLVAWSGKIANQPYYEKPNPADPEYAAKLAIYQQAEAGGVSLLATENQYVVHFDHPANKLYEGRIVGPKDF